MLLEAGGEARFQILPTENMTLTVVARHLPTTGLLPALCYAFRRAAFLEINASTTESRRPTLDQLIVALSVIRIVVLPDRVGDEYREDLAVPAEADHFLR